MRHVKAGRSGRDLHEAALPGRRALLVDQHPLWHEAVELVLRRLEVEVMGRFVDPDEALSALEEEAADLLVVDIEGGRLVATGSGSSGSPGRGGRRCASSS